MQHPGSRILVAILVGVLLVLSTAVSPRPLVAQESSSEGSLETGNWTLTLPLWIPGYRGSFAVGEIDVDGESDGGPGFFDRLFENKLSLNFFFMGSAKYRHDRWRFYLFVFGGKFTDDVIFKLTDGTVLTASVQPIIPELQVGYDVYKWQWGDSEFQDLIAEPFTGFRYYDVRVTAKGGGDNVDVKTEVTWWDPIIGVWLPVNLSRRWLVESSVDVGGFGLGSELSWRVQVGGKFRAGSLVHFKFGYNVLDVDYRDVVAGQDFIYNVRIGGPYAGISFNF